MQRLIVAALAGVLFALPAHAEGDAAKGENVFKKCRACHDVGEGAKHKVGPELNDLFGRTAGSVEGFNYSAAMKAAGEEGLVWDDDTLAQYLKDPRNFVPKNKMAFAGLKKDDEVADVIAYLHQFSQ
jgi:cytochrome c2